MIIELIFIHESKKQSTAEKIICLDDLEKYIRSVQNQYIGGFKCRENPANHLDCTKSIWVSLYHYACVNSALMTRRENK